MREPPSDVSLSSESHPTRSAASMISVLAQRRNVWVVCVVVVLLWGLLDMRSTAQFRRRHQQHQHPTAAFEAHDPFHEANHHANSGGGLNREGGSDSVVGGASVEGRSSAASSRTPHHRGGGFEVLDKVATDRHWSRRLTALLGPPTARRPVELVFFAGLEGTGHHFWQTFLKRFCAQHSGGNNTDGGDVMAPPATCVALPDKVFRIARETFKRCAPKFTAGAGGESSGGSGVSGGNNASVASARYYSAAGGIKTAKLLTIRNHCYQRKASQQGLADVAEGVLAAVQARLRPEAGGMGAGGVDSSGGGRGGADARQAAGRNNNNGTAVRTPVLVFANTYGNSQMWSYPNGKTFNEGRGWNPDASALALVAARLGLGFRVVWLRRHPAALLGSTARRNFAEKKSRSKGVDQLIAAHAAASPSGGGGGESKDRSGNNTSDADNAAPSLGKQLGLRGKGLDKAARLLDYLGVLRHSQRTLTAQLACVHDLDASFGLASATAAGRQGGEGQGGGPAAPTPRGPGNSSASVLAVWHRDVACRPARVAASVGAFLVGSADASGRASSSSSSSSIIISAQQQPKDSWVRAFEEVAECSRGTAALGDVYTDDSLQGYISTLPKSEELANRVRAFASYYVASSSEEGCGSLPHCREALAFPASRR